MNSTPAMIFSCSFTRRRPSMAYSSSMAASSFVISPSGKSSFARPLKFLRTPVSSRLLKSLFRRKYWSIRCVKSRLRISRQNSERQSVMSP